MEGGEEGVREEGVQRTAGKRGCPKLSCELNGRDVMDAKQLSSGRSQVSAVSRFPLPTPKPSPSVPCLCSSFYTHRNISGNLPKGQKAKKNHVHSLSLTHTHFYQ